MMIPTTIKFNQRRNMQEQRNIRLRWLNIFSRVISPTSRTTVRRRFRKREVGRSRLERGIRLGIGIKCIQINSRQPMVLSILSNIDLSVSSRGRRHRSGRILIIVLLPQIITVQWPGQLICGTHSALEKVKRWKIMMTIPVSIINSRKVQLLSRQITLKKRRSNTNHSKTDLSPNKSIKRKCLTSSIWKLIKMFITQWRWSMCIWGIQYHSSKPANLMITQYRRTMMFLCLITETWRQVSQDFTMMPSQIWIKTVVKRDIWNHLVQKVPRWGTNTMWRIIIVRTKTTR